jgi:hypothetical protein
VLKIRSLRARISSVEAEADGVFYSVSQNKKRTPCSGPEARAALKLRILCEYIKSCFKSTITIQKYARRFVLRRRFKKTVKARSEGIRLIQRSIRGYLGRCKAAALRIQQWSQWEQLWDNKRALLYYFNRVEFRSTYEEPEEPFRPLVRDRLSARLVQAWPFLDKEGGRSELQIAKLADALNEAQYPENYEAAGALISSEAGEYAEYSGEGGPVIVNEVRSGSPSKSAGGYQQQQQPLTAGPVDTKNMCGNCGIRNILRYCSDCAFEKELAHFPHTPQPVTYSTLYPDGFPVCFPCFQTMHDPGSNRQDHRFSEVAPDTQARAYLQCSMCTKPATRKCVGLLTAHEVEDIVMDLAHAGPERWFTILQNANVGSDDKIVHMLEVLKADPEQRKLTAVQVQQVKDLLERSKAECDDCFCTECYIMVHTKGRRALHKWKGFQEYADICGVCTNAPAEVNCGVCHSKFCDSCFTVFHNMGFKKRHKRTPVMEEMNATDTACELCHRRRAEFSCPNNNCETRCCDSCFECVHKPRCDYQHKKGDYLANMRMPSPTKSTKSGESTLAPSSKTGGSLSSKQPQIVLCVSCGEPADKRCVECGDYYCSNTWMGNAGCFADFHAKGNRSYHTTEPFYQQTGNEEEGAAEAEDAVDIRFPSNRSRATTKGMRTSKSGTSAGASTRPSTSGTDEDDHASDDEDGDRLSPTEDLGTGGPASTSKLSRTSGKPKHHHHHHHHSHRHHGKHHHHHHRNQHSPTSEVGDNGSSRSAMA